MAASRWRWAAVDVDLFLDDKLLVRQVWERYLWVCLILLARKTGYDGVLKNYTATALSSLFGLGVGGPKVAETLRHFAAQGMLQLHHDGRIELVNFDRYQPGREDPAKVRARVQKYRDKNRDVTPLSRRDTDPESTPNHSPPVTPVSRRYGEIGNGAALVSSQTLLPGQEQRQEQPQLQGDHEAAGAFSGAAEAAAGAPLKAVAGYVSHTWPELADPTPLLAEAARLYPTLDLLQIARKARAKQVAGSGPRGAIGPWLLGWFEREASSPVPSGSGYRNGRGRNGTHIDAPPPKSDEQRMEEAADSIALQLAGEEVGQPSAFTEAVLEEHQRKVQARAAEIRQSKTTREIILGWNPDAPKNGAARHGS